MNIGFWPKNPKANFQNGKMNVSAVITMNYEQKTMNDANKNKPKTNPIKANLPGTKLTRIFCKSMYRRRLWQIFLQSLVDSGLMGYGGAGSP